MFQRVNLRRHFEIVIGEAIYVVRDEREFHLVPCDKHIWVVIGAFD